MPNRIAFCTIATPGFLPMAAVLIDSIRAHYGDTCDIHLLTVSWERIKFSYRGVEAVYFTDLANPYCWDMAMRYDLVERASAYKPFFLRHVNADRRYDTVFYLDVDTQLFGRLDEATDLMRSTGASILLSPHSLVPRNLGRLVDDRTILRVGTFNSGLIGVDASDEALSFLDWWASLNRTECIVEPGYYSRDQKWLNLVPTYFERAQILRHPGYNVAHFNVDERSDVLTDGSLRMFHYTYVHQMGWDIEKYMRAFDIKPNKALSSLLPRYIAAVAAKRTELEVQFKMQMTNAADASRDFHPDARATYRASNPVARRLELADFEKLAAQARDAVTA
jgi:hypothetical protein